MERHKLLKRQLRKDGVIKVSEQKLPADLVEEKVNELKEAGIEVIDIIWVEKQEKPKTDREKYLERLEKP